MERKHYKKLSAVYDTTKNILEDKRLSGKSKYDRILSLYTKLLRGDLVRKDQMATEFDVNTRTIQRDLDDIRAFLSNNTLGVCYGKRLVYDRRQRGYRLETQENERFTNGEMLAVYLLLRGSEVLSSDEQNVLVRKFLDLCGGDEALRRFIEEIHTGENKG